MAIKHPRTTVESGLKGKEALEALFTDHKVQTTVQDWYHEIEEALRAWNEEIWTNIGEKYIGVYSPEKAFVSIKPRPTCLNIECFSRGVPIQGTKVSNQKFSPRWAKFSIKHTNEIQQAIDILKESHNRVKSAILAGEPTAYFSGGKRPGNDEGQNEVAQT